MAKRKAPSSKCSAIFERLQADVRLTDGTTHVQQDLPDVEKKPGKKRQLNITQSMPVLPHVQRATSPRLTRSEDFDLLSDDLPDPVAAAYAPTSSSTAVESSGSRITLPSSATTVDRPLKKQKKRHDEPPELDLRLEFPADCLAFAPRGSRWWPARVLRYEGYKDDGKVRSRPYEVQFGDDGTLQWKSREEIATIYDDAEQFASVPIGEIRVEEQVSGADLTAALDSIVSRLALIARGLWPATLAHHEHFLDSASAQRQNLAHNAELSTCTAERANQISEFCSEWLRSFLISEGKDQPLAKLSSTDRILYVTAVLLPAVVELLEIESEELLSLDKPDEIMAAHENARQTLDARPQIWAQKILAARQMMQAANLDG